MNGLLYMYTFDLGNKEDYLPCVSSVLNLWVWAAGH